MGGKTLLLTSLCCFKALWHADLCAHHSAPCFGCSPKPRGCDVVLKLPPSCFGEPVTTFPPLLYLTRLGKSLISLAMLWHIPLNRWDILFAATTNVGPPVELSPCSARGLGCTPCSFSPSFSSMYASARLERAQKASFGDLSCCCPARLAVL